MTLLFRNPVHDDHPYFFDPKPFASYQLYQLGELICPRGYLLEEHIQVCYEITYVVSGTGWFSTNGKVHRLGPGDIYIHIPGETHAGGADHADPFRYCYFGFRFHSNAEGTHRFKQIQKSFDTHTVPVCRDRLGIRAPFFGALRELREPSLYAEDMLESFLNQLIILTYRNFFTSWDSPSDMGKPGGGAEEAVYRAMQYIDRHLSDMKDLSELSRAVGYSYSYLSYLFAKTTGMNLRAYFTHKRKQKVLELMRSGRHSLTEIAEMMNYRSIHTFSRAFKKAFGVSPSEYKKRHMQTAEN